MPLLCLASTIPLAEMASALAHTTCQHTLAISQCILAVYHELISDLHVGADLADGVCICGKVHYLSVVLHLALHERQEALLHESPCPLFLHGLELHCQCAGASVHEF